MIYVIWAKEKFYNGINDVCDYIIIEADSVEYVEALAKKMSIIVIKDKDIATDANWDEDKIDKLTNEDISYIVYIVNNSNKDYETLALEFYNAPEEFIDEYCVEIANV